MSPSEIVLQIEQILKEKRIKKADFYKATGVSSASFSQWRKNGHTPELKTLMRVNSFLGTNFGITEVKENPAPLEGDGIDKYDIKLMSLIKQMNEEQKKLALALIEAQIKAQEAEKEQ